MLGNPVTIGALKGLDLVLGDAVQLLARNVVVDLRRPLTVGAVRAAQVRRVRYTVRTLCPRAAKAAPLGTGSIELTRAALGAFTEAPALPFTFTARAITKRFPVTVAIGLTVAITVARTLAISFTVTVTETATLAIALATRTITKRLPITITEVPTLAIALTARTITKRLPITITERLTVAITEVPALPFALATRAITKRFPITITERLTIAITVT
ncbi:MULTISPECIES: hypothetical protein [Arthrobacter]|uniref:hypothetical protein n=1 Tax=Arthrobacter TaxID=1663 RepID=UPI001F3B7007|nr:MULTISPECIES: hypothetical protein [Arthrobacter]